MYDITVGSYITYCTDISFFVSRYPYQIDKIIETPLCKMHCVETALSLVLHLKNKCEANFLSTPYGPHFSNALQCFAFIMFIVIAVLRVKQIT